MVASVGTESTTTAQLWELIRREYEPGRVIANGRDGTTIRKAVHRESGHEVVLKVMPVADRRARERARKEGHVLTSLLHPNVVQCYAVFECMSEVVLALEYCAGGDMLDRINTHGKYTEKQAKIYFSQIAEALAICYASGFSHRDVKLDNIFIHVTADRRESLKLADFGFSERYRPRERYRHSCGTLAYAAPELLVHWNDVYYDGEKADVWSAGVVLYSLVCGELPFNCRDDRELAALIKTGKYHLPARLTTPLKELIQSLLHMDPDRRPNFAAILQHRWLSPTPSLQPQRKAPLLRSPSVQPRSVKRAWSAADVSHLHSKTARGGLVDPHLWQKLLGLAIVG
jgi:serine/threonine protein kinase